MYFSYFLNLIVKYNICVLKRENVIEFVLLLNQYANCLVLFYVYTSFTVLLFHLTIEHMLHNMIVIMHKRWGKHTCSEVQNKDGTITDILISQ